MQYMQYALYGHYGSGYGSIFSLYGLSAHTARPFSRLPTGHIYQRPPQLLPDRSSSVNCSVSSGYTAPAFIPLALGLFGGIATIITADQQKKGPSRIRDYRQSIYKPLPSLPTLPT